MSQPPPELGQWLLECAQLHNKIVDKVLAVLEGEEVFEVTDLRLLHEEGRLDILFTTVTARKLRDALGANTAPVASLPAIPSRPINPNPASQSPDDHTPERLPPPPHKPRTSETTTIRPRAMRSLTMDAPTPPPASHVNSTTSKLIMLLKLQACARGWLGTGWQQCVH